MEEKQFYYLICNTNANNGSTTVVAKENPNEKPKNQKPTKTKPKAQTHDPPVTTVCWGLRLRLQTFNQHCHDLANLERQLGSDLWRKKC